MNVRQFWLILTMVASFAIVPAGGLSAGEPPPAVTADCWAVADARTGDVLHGSDAHVGRKTASISKVMCLVTVLTLAKQHPEILDEWVTFSELADATYGSTADINAGESLQVRECLYALMLPSGNDAGNALAEHFHARLEPPDEALLAEGLDNPILSTRVNFIAEMNRNARAIGLKDTVYRSSFGDGGTSEQMTSTAADLCRLAHHALKMPLFKQYVSTQSYTGTVRQVDGSTKQQTWTSTNKLLALDAGYDGIKTGTTRQAGYCLLATGQRPDQPRLIVVVLGCDSTAGRFVDAQNLFNWAWRIADAQP